MYSAMVAYRLRASSQLVHSSAAYMASSNGGHSQSSSPKRWSVFPVILLSIWWLNAYNTFIIASVAPQLLIPYNITVCNTSVYIIDLYLNEGPVFSSSFNTTPHRLCTFPRLWYRASHLLSLYVMVWPNQLNAATEFRGSKLTWLNCTVSSGTSPTPVAIGAFVSRAWKRWVNGFIQYFKWCMNLWLKEA